MKGNGNSFGTLLRKLYFFILPTCGMRTNYLLKHRKMFKTLGDKLLYQPRKLPADPEWISIGNNVKIASGVTFINHDIIDGMLNDRAGEKIFKPYFAPIKIDDNVMIGANSMIMPNVHICSDVIIAAGSIVSKDITSSGVWGGVPAKRLKSFEDFIEKRKNENGK